METTRVEDVINNVFREFAVKTNVVVVDVIAEYYLLLQQQKRLNGGDRKYAKRLRARTHTHELNWIGMPRKMGKNSQGASSI